MRGDEIPVGAGRRPGAWTAPNTDAGTGSGADVSTGASASDSLALDAAIGPGQVSAPPRIDADIAAIEELRAWIRHLWSGLAAPAHTYLGVRLELLSSAVERRATDSCAVRKALQQVLLNIGTGALATLSDSSRHRLTALTGIALPPG